MTMYARNKDCNGDLKQKRLLMIKSVYKNRKKLSRVWNYDNRRRDHKTIKIPYRKILKANNYKQMHRVVVME